MEMCAGLMPTYHPGIFIPNGFNLNTNKDAHSQGIFLNTVLHMKCWKRSA